MEKIKIVMESEVLGEIEGTMYLLPQYVSAVLDLPEYLMFEYNGQFYKTFEVERLDEILSWIKPTRSITFEADED